MTRKALPLAVAAVFAGPTLAVAQKTTIEIYGRANLGFDHYQAKGSSVAGADRDGRFRVFENSSRVGFRGTEDLGGGLKALFQIESGVAMDSGNDLGQGGQTNESAGFWAPRDSFVGLDSNWGRLTFGRQSIYRANGVNAQFSSSYINSQVPGRTAGGSAASALASWSPG